MHVVTFVLYVCVYVPVCVCIRAAQRRHLCMCVGLSLYVCVYNNVHIFLLLFAPRIIMGLACEQCRCRKVGLGPKTN